jgi:hypothetical protein
MLKEEELALSTGAPIFFIPASTIINIFPGGAVSF